MLKAGSLFRLHYKDNYTFLIETIIYFNKNAVFRFMTAGLCSKVDKILTQEGTILNLKKGDQIVNKGEIIFTPISYAKLKIMNPFNGRETEFLLQKGFS